MVSLSYLEFFCSETFSLMSVPRKFGRSNGYYWFIVLKCSRYLISRNLCSSTNGVEMARMQQRYALLNKKCEEHITTLDQVNPRDVFVNNEVKLNKIQVYGFDYDYTLAHYTSDLDEFIFNESRNWLVEQMKMLPCIMLLNVQRYQSFASYRMLFTNQFHLKLLILKKF